MDVRAEARTYLRDKGNNLRDKGNGLRDKGNGVRDKGNGWSGRHLGRGGGCARRARFAVKKAKDEKRVLRFAKDDNHMEDAHHNLWMSCNRGIYRVKKQELNEYAEGPHNPITSVAYGKIDGMLNVECNGGYSPAGTKASDGKLWFPTQEGVAVIDPETIPLNTQPPPVVIESMLADHVPAAITGPAHIPLGKNNLEIQYTALSFIHSERIRFRYRMQGLDTTWVEAGSRRTAYYSHLPPGNYLFQVIAGNSDGVWNTQGQSLEIVIPAPFYRTWWFAMIALLSAASILFYSWNRRVTFLKRAQATQQAFSQQLIASQENERRRIAAELHDSIGQRLVVINNLALFFLRSHDTGAEKSDEIQFIEEISTEAESAIEETRSISYDLRPFQLDQLGLTKAVESLIRRVSKASGIKFTAQLENVDEIFAEELRINFYRIVQESLNNVMKHSHATETEVSIQRGKTHVMLTIRDNGQGFTQAEQNAQAQQIGFGLNGMTERAHLLGGELKIRSAPQSGTTLMASFPL